MFLTIVQYTLTYVGDFDYSPRKIWKVRTVWILKTILKCK